MKIVIYVCKREKVLIGKIFARKYDGYPKTSIPSNMDSFQLALEFGILVMVIACRCALGLPNCSYGWYWSWCFSRRLIKGGQSTGKRMQGGWNCWLMYKSFLLGTYVGGKGACTKLSLPNVEISETNDEKGQTALHMAAQGHNYKVGEHDFAYSNT
uniref:Probable copper-transporting ATPase HMA5 n=1 Tax=Tanacetum cinerariifolium TaxID=118510 RepID=A0A699HX46_TANCI|nr:probable copper-transporting ATPase HMA5 [Tanacetum cinerariifolium]